MSKVYAINEQKGKELIEKLKKHNKGELSIEEKEDLLNEVIDQYLFLQYKENVMENDPTFNAVYILVAFKDMGNQKNDDKVDTFGKSLREEGFKCGAGYWGCPWIFVDIKNKIFNPGRPGVSYGKVFFDHAVSIEEFKIIYDIYKKYRGLNPLDFTGVENYEY